MKHRSALHLAPGLVPWMAAIAWALLLPVRPAATAPPPPGAAAAAPAGSAARRDWRLLYPSIDDPRAHGFVHAALEAGRGWLGDPALPVREVRLRLSLPESRDPGLPAGFRQTETDDAERGIHTIYISARPGETAFHGQLAHEVFHLFEPRFRDIYIEGLNTYLAARLLKSLDLPWTPWEEHFRAGKDPLYGAAYALMVELERAAGEGALLDLVRFKEPFGAAGTEGEKEMPRYRVSIDRWIRSLDPGLRPSVRAAILRRFPALEAERLRSHQDYAFEIPHQS